MAIQVIVVVLASAVYLYAMMHPARVLTASTLFAYLQMVMAVGSFLLFDASNPADVAHSWVIAVATALFLTSNLLHTLTRRRMNMAPGTITPYRLQRGDWVLLFVSVAIVGAYYAAVGSSALFLGIQSILTGMSADIATTRLNAYASDRYLFPGYVNQFKNVLLPGLVVVLFSTSSNLHHRLGPRLLLAPLGLIALLGLLGTGQRGAFVMFATTCFVFLYFLSGKRLSRKTVMLTLFATSIVLTATVALGRSASDWQAHGGIVQKVGLAGTEFAERITHDQQMSSVAGFRYIYYQPVQNGREWVESFMGVLPGFRGSDLDGRIFATLYGSTRGTSPPSIWGSVYHNFGWSGVIILPIAIGIALSIVSSRGMAHRHTNTLELLGVSGVFVTFGFWTSDPPTFLLNSGIVVYAWMWWRGRCAALRNEGIMTKESDDERSAFTAP